MSKLESPNPLQAALQVVSVGLEEIAAEAGCSASLLRYVRAGKRTPSPEITHRITDALRGHARRLDTLVARLEREHRVSTPSLRRAGA